MPVMRAKMRVARIETFPNSTHEKLHLVAVAKSTAYPEDGTDEDNSYAKWSPSASLEIYIANPALCGKFAVDQKFYVDFTRVSG